MGDEVQAHRTVSLMTSPAEPFDSDNWDPSHWDWAGSRSGRPEDEAGLLDDDGDDCPHPWHALGFVDEESGDGVVGVACAYCRGVWDSSNPETVLFLWNASKSAHAILFSRLTMLESLVERKLNAASCVVCGHWDDSSSGLDLGERHACFDHVGVAVGDPAVDPVPLMRVLEWARGGGLPSATDLARRATWERLVAASPALAAAADDEDDDAALDRGVNLDDVASLIGLAPASSMRTIALSLSSWSDLDPPVTRLASGYLLNLLNIARAALVTAALRTPEALDGAIDKALPWDDELRMMIAVELCFPGVPDNVEFSGDMAEDALRLSSRRVVDGIIARYGRR